MKIITICGSLKFKDEMMITAEELSLKGNCVLTPIYPALKGLEKTSEELEMLKRSHFKKIELSDAVYIINKDGYIGESTKLEIEYAKKLNKEIIYLEK